MTATRIRFLLAPMLLVAALLCATASPALGSAGGGAIRVADTRAGVGASSAKPPSCSTTSKNTDCVHAPTSDVTVQPLTHVRTAFAPKYRQRSLDFSATIIPPYHTCPGGGVPIEYLPCTFPGLGVSARLYMPDGSPAVGVGGSDGVSGTDCMQFTCKDVKIMMPSEYFGPGTLIVTVGVGELLAGPSNDLSGSSYETTIHVPASPAKRAVHIVKPHVVYSGKVKSATFQLAGKGGVPRSGVAGVIVRAAGSGAGAISGYGDGFGNSIGIVEVTKGTKLHIKKSEAGSMTLTTLGYYSSRSSLSGDLLNTLRVPAKVHPAKQMRLTGKGVPKDATSALLIVNSPKGTSTFGGVKVAKCGFGQYVVAPLSHGGVLRGHLSRGTTVSVAGFTVPIGLYAEGITVNNVTATESLSNILSLPEVD
jgi:hypothetical protein